MPKRRQYDEMENVLAGVVEVIGEERLLEHMLMNLSVEERQDLASELLGVDPFRTNEASEAWSGLIIEQLEDLENRDSEMADSVKMNLIWRVAGLSQGSGNGN